MAYCTGTQSWTLLFRAMDHSPPSHRIIHHDISHNKNWANHSLSVRTMYHISRQICNQHTPTPDISVCPNPASMLWRTGWFTLVTRNILIGKTSRRFLEVDSERLHNCALVRYERFHRRVFFTSRFFKRFPEVPACSGSPGTPGIPGNRWKQFDRKKFVHQNVSSCPIVHVCNFPQYNSKTRREF